MLKQIKQNGNDDQQISALKAQDDAKTSRLRKFSQYNQLSFKLSDIKQLENVHEVKYNEGTSYVGELKNRKKHGKGRLTDPNGSVYQGDFHNDKIEGFGVFKGQDGTEYRGEWKNGMQHGLGRELWTDGSYYEGTYKMGLKHGKGFYQWADGSSFDGDWDAGNINGYVGL